MQEINILITALGSPLGQSIYKAVKISSLNINIYGSDVDELAAGLEFPKIKKVFLPKVTDISYLDKLKQILDDKKIKIIFPALSSEHELLIKNMSYFEEKNIFVVTPSFKTFTICNDKYESMRYLSARGVTVPFTVLASNSSDKNIFLDTYLFPVILKPRFGASSNDVYIVNDLSKLNGLISAFPSGYFVLQQFLSEPAEYTAGVMTSRNGTKRKVFILERNLKFGLSYSGRVIVNPDIEKYCLNIAGELNSSYSINIQLKMQNGVPYAYEINPRLSSTTSIRAHFNFNEPEMIIKEVLGIQYEFFTPHTMGSFSRYWEELYKDF